MDVSEQANGLADRFAAKFGGRRPAWIIRAPGRINLIGEHTDYNGFPVLPMAIDRAIRMAIAPRNDATAELKDVHESRYEDRQFEVSDSIPPSPAGDWGNYVKAAVQSLVRLALGAGWELEELKGFSCLIAGDIPPAAGLASSTALVVAAGLAFGAVNRLGLGRRAMAERMAEAEHYVGTQGGGMDQAVSLLGREGEALKIDFYPLRTARYRFPEDYRVLAAYSTVRAGKSGEVRLAFNRRVLECSVGAHLLARKLGVGPPERLSELTPHAPNALTALPELLTEIVEGHRSLTLRRAAVLFGMTPGQFARRFLRMEDGRLLPAVGGGLQVLQRCRHAFSEAQRTEWAASCLSRGDMEGFGRLMDESHRSCAEDYEVSCYELDRLVEVMRGGGALGARLTGAGFGGFAIALVHRDGVEQVRRALAEEFYAPRELSLPGNVFVFSPAQGALATRLQ
jgi:N-acetylgalactosamine kinase